MKTLNSFKLMAITGMLALTLGGCQYDEDPGSYQRVEAEYTFIDFDRLDMGDALSVTVTKGSEYSIHVEGDQRNVEDLVVKRDGSTLEMHYRNGWRIFRRNHTTYVTIVMPGLVSAEFSGAVTSDIKGFETEDFHLGLSGASTCTMELTTTYADFDLSGASDLTIKGAGVSMDASLSGASDLSALEFAVQDADLSLTGASTAKVNAAERLKANASGASDVVYRGTPSLVVSLSGSSHVKSE